MPRTERTGCLRLASRSRGVPSATASTRSASVSGASGGSSRVAPAGSPGTARRHITWPCSTSSRLATYSVRPDTRTWLGAGSPRAAATNDGAAIAVPDSTVQSGKKPWMCSPSRRLKMASDEPQRRVELLRPQPGVEVAEVVLRHQGQGARRDHPGVGEGLAGQVGALQHGHARQCGDLRAVVLRPVGEHHHDVLAVARGELEGYAIGERAVPAHDDVIPDGGQRGHGQIIMKTAR